MRSNERAFHAPVFAAAGADETAAESTSKTSVEALGYCACELPLVPRTRTCAAKRKRSTSFAAARGGISSRFYATSRWDPRGGRASPR